MDVTRRAGVLAVAALLAWAGGTTAVADRAGAAGRPNIIMIMTDDESATDMSYMPKTKALLGNNGTTFTNFYVSLSKCCPSRASFLTGQYPHNHGVQDTDENAPGGGYPALIDKEQVLPVWLQRAGYYTSFVGKYLNGDPFETPPGWNDWHALRKNRYQMYGYSINHNGQERTYGTTPADYQTDVLNGEALRVLASRKGKTNPFFLYLAPMAPHAAPDESGPEPAPRHKGMFAAEPLPRSPAYNEADLSDKPPYYKFRGPVDDASMARHFHDRIESLQAVDEMVGNVVAQLKADGQLGNTVIMFTSDNGFLLGQHRLIGKTWVYEDSIRVPLIIRNGGFPVGRAAGQLTANIDLAPTVLALAGASANRTIDGRDLKPLALDATKGRERSLVISGVVHQPGTTYGPLHFRALHTEAYVWVEYEGSTARELYDLAKDPHQLTNRAGDGAYASVKADLSSKLSTQRTCRGTTCSRGTP